MDKTVGRTLAELPGRINWRKKTLLRPTVGSIPFLEGQYNEVYSSKVVALFPGSPLPGKCLHSASATAAAMLHYQARQRQWRHPASELSSHWVLCSVQIAIPSLPSPFVMYEHCISSVPLENQYGTFHHIPSQ